MRGARRNARYTRDRRAARRRRKGGRSEGRGVVVVGIVGTRRRRPHGRRQRRRSPAAAECGRVVLSVSEVSSGAIRVEALNRSCRIVARIHPPREQSISNPAAERRLHDVRSSRLYLAGRRAHSEHGEHDLVRLAVPEAVVLGIARALRAEVVAPLLDVLRRRRRRGEGTRAPPLRAVSSYDFSSLHGTMRRDSRQRSARGDANLVGPSRKHRDDLFTMARLSTARGARRRPSLGRAGKHRDDLLHFLTDCCCWHHHLYELGERRARGERRAPHGGDRLHEHRERPRALVRLRSGRSCCATVVS